MTTSRRFIDIGANLTDKMFRGLYRGSQRHPDDFDAMLSRAFSIGVDKIIMTAGSYSEACETVELSHTDKRLLTTAGCHPTRCSEMESDSTGYIQQIETLIKKNSDKIVAVGECGLDYDREQFCPRVVQQKQFNAQLQMASRVRLPLFLHCRAAHTDMVDALTRAQKEVFHDHPIRGVIHTFDGSLSDAEKFLQMGLFLGVNGCSLKTEDNLTVVRQIPVDRLLLETDAPWCDIRPTHAGFKYVKSQFPTRKMERWEPGCMVKGRNEPAKIVQVLEIVAELKQMDPDALAEQAYQNTIKLFNL